MSALDAYFRGEARRMIDAGEIDLATEDGRAFLRAFHGGQPVSLRNRFARECMNKVTTRLRDQGRVAEKYRTAPLGRVSVANAPSSSPSR